MTMPPFTVLVALPSERTFAPSILFRVSAFDVIVRPLMSTDSVPSEGQVLAVLEVNGGLSDLLGIRRGDLVLHEAFGTAPAPAQN